LPVLEENTKNGNVTNLEEFQKFLDSYLEDLIGIRQKMPPRWSLRASIIKLVETHNDLGKKKLCELLLKAYLGDGQLALSAVGTNSMEDLQYEPDKGIDFLTYGLCYIKRTYSKDNNRLFYVLNEVHIHYKFYIVQRISQLKQLIHI
jgi:hypothetical protein